MRVLHCRNHSLLLFLGAGTDNIDALDLFNAQVLVVIPTNLDNQKLVLVGAIHRGQG